MALVRDNSSLNSSNLVKRIQVTGEMSRAEWEELYILAQELAEKHGLTVDGLDLKPANSDDTDKASERLTGAQETDGD